MNDHPRVLSVATATPPHRFPQTQTRDAARAIFAERLRDFDRLAPVFTNSGIEARHSCVPLDWYREPRGWSDRNAAYLAGAVEVLEKCAWLALERAGLAPGEIDAIVTVSSTGIATPSLEARLIDRIGFRPDVRRMPLFGLGCAGGVIGLARAAGWSREFPKGHVLLLVVELCTLSFRHDSLSKANIVATALFGDGAGAAIVTARQGHGGISVRGWHEHTWPETLGVMGWDVDDTGLGVVFAQSIPALVRERFAEVTRRFLDDQGLAVDDLEGSICHPGGAKVIDALAEVLAPCVGGLDDARAVLKDHGNMSAATVLFVLERRWRSGAAGTHLMTALGPGFTAALALLEL